MKKFFKALIALISCLLVLLQGSGVLSVNVARVAGGTSTTIHKIPFLVQIEKDGIFHCGGSLLTEFHILTAAHCLDNTRPEQLLVKAGASKRTEPGIITCTVSSYITPPAFNMMTFDADIAVLKVTTPMTSIPTAPLSLKGWRPGNKLQVWGWGALGEHASSPVQLQTATIEVIDKARCSNVLNYVRILTGSMFCGYAQNKNSCYGDSGGPALVNGEVVGVVSWGVGCTGYDVYTDLRVMYPFIDYAIKTL